MRRACRAGWAVRALGALLLLALCGGGYAGLRAQTVLYPPQIPTAPSFGQPADEPELGLPVSERQRLERKLNQDRYKKLLADTDRLLALTAELEADMASLPAQELTNTQVNKLLTIEKLARDIRKRMNFWLPPEEPKPLLRQQYPGRW